MKTHFVLCIAICSLLCGCKAKNIAYQIDGAVQRELTNDVVGFSRMVKVDMAKFHGGPTNWLANATVDYVNRSGGIERTNLFYRFIVADNGKLYATLDEEKLAEQSREEFEERMRAASTPK